MTTPITELTQTYQAVYHQLYERARKAFLLLQVENLIFGRPDEQLVNGEYVKHPSTGYDFDGFDLVGATGSYPSNISLKGERYAGGGEYDHVEITIPLTVLDNLEAYVSQEHAKIMAEKQKKLAQQAKADQERKQQEEQHERETYQRLHQKYGSPKPPTVGREKGYCKHTYSQEREKKNVKVTFTEGTWNVYACEECIEGWKKQGFQVQEPSNV